MVNDALSDDPTGRWGLIFHGSGLYTPTHTRADWSRIAEAIKTADLAHETTASVHIGRPVVRGDAAWCRIAADTFADLAAAAQLSVPWPDSNVCFVDDAAVRAWLDAPWVPPGDQPQTMAGVVGWDAMFDPRCRPEPASVTDLIEAAQRAGLFGIPHHRIAVWQAPDRGGAPTFIVTVQPPQGPGWASPPVGRDRLVHNGLAATDVVVDLLVQVAGVANRLLDIGGRAPEAPQHPPQDHYVPLAQVGGGRVGNPGRAFPPLRQVHPIPVTDVRPSRGRDPDSRPPRGASHA